MSAFGEVCGKYSFLESSKQASIAAFWNRESGSTQHTELMVMADEHITS